MATTPLCHCCHLLGKKGFCILTGENMCEFLIKEVEKFVETPMSCPLRGGKDITLTWKKKG